MSKEKRRIQDMRKELSYETEEALKNLQKELRWIKSGIEDAEHRLSSGLVPNRRGIIQARGSDVDQAVARYDSATAAEKRFNQIFKDEEGE